jgi:hypothetical protein
LENSGFVEAAVTVLKNNGYDAWKNCVGHIAFAPIHV